LASQRSRGQPLITPRLCRSRYQISMVARRSITCMQAEDFQHIVKKEKMEVKIMAKLVLPKSAYKGIPGVKKCKKQTSPEYEELAEKATKRIREKQLQQAKAAKDAENYFCK